MSGTMSSASSDWLQFSQHSNQPPSRADMGWTGEATTAVSAVNLTSTSPPQTGRVSKPNTRRRSRASRRTPTTLLSTDTTNFRAMVQQFTGGSGAAGQTVPPPPFISTNNSTNDQFLGSTYNNNSANLNFGLGPTSSVVAGPLSGPGAYNVQFRQPQERGSGGSGGGGRQQQQFDFSSTDNTNFQHQAFLQSRQNYSSAGPTRESSTDVLPTPGEDSKYMF